MDIIIAISYWSPIEAYHFQITISLILDFIGLNTIMQLEFTY